MNLTDWLLKVCSELGLQIDVGFVLLLESGYKIHSVARIPNLGATNGMLVIRSDDEVRAHSDELIRAGYGYSVLDDPWETKDLELDLAKEMFADWGWSGVPQFKPTWISTNKAV